MLRRAKLFMIALNLTYVQRIALKNLISQYVKNFNLKWSRPTKHAPIIKIDKMIDLARQLWDAKFPRNLGSLNKRRMAALQIMICCFSGARWVDCCRIAWNRLNINKFSHGTFVQFHLPFSKADIGNSNSKIITISSTSDPRKCPVEFLKKFWIFKGKPTAGFIFSVKNTHINGNCTYYQMQTFAKKLNWTVLPTKHSLRVAFCVFLSLNNVPREKIIQALNWKFDTTMIQRYVAWHTAQAPDAPAALIARELDKIQPFEVLNTAISTPISLNTTQFDIE